MARLETSSVGPRRRPLTPLRRLTCSFQAPGSHFSRLLEKCAPLSPADRATTLEDDEELAAEYKVVALQGDTQPPANAEDEVDFHYICFVKSHKDGNRYALDGSRKGPVNWGPVAGDDMLSEECLRVVKEFILSVAKDVGFNMLALAPEQHEER